MWWLAALSLMASPQEARQELSFSAPLDFVSYSFTERDRTRVWTAYADGRASYSEYDLRQVRIAGSELRSPSQAFQALSETLHPLQTAHRLSCDNPWRSAPDAGLSWSRGVQTVELSLRQGCGSEEVGAVFRQLIAASLVTHRLSRNDRWEEISPDMAPTVRTPLPPSVSTGPAVVVSSSEGVDAISYREIAEGGSFGESWHIGSDGSGQFIDLPDPERPVRVTALAVGSAQFERMRRELSELENVQAACTEIIEFHPAIGFLFWVRGDQSTTLRLDSMCLTQLGQGSERIAAEWLQSAIEGNADQ